MEMTITRGLSELKLLDSRIQRKIGESKIVIQNKKSSNKVGNITTKEEFISNAKSEYQSVLDLIERRKVIKSAIVASNASTMISISSKNMTVAEAIERKESIKYDQQLLNNLEVQFRSATSFANKENEKVEASLEQVILVAFGKENKQKVSESDIEVISKPYREQNQFEILDPMGVEKIIKDMKDDIESFMFEVDFILSESNTITKITA